MKILFDHCVPKGLRRAFSHDVRTTREMGWERLVNGKLLAAAASQFDLLLTVDRRMKYQQSETTLPISVVVLIAKSNRLTHLLPLVPEVEKAISGLTEPVFLEIRI